MKYVLFNDINFFFTFPNIYNERLERCGNIRTYKKKHTNLTSKWR